MGATSEDTMVVSPICGACGVRLTSAETDYCTGCARLHAEADAISPTPGERAGEGDTLLDALIEQEERRFRNVPTKEIIAALRSLVRDGYCPSAFHWAICVAIARLASDAAGDDTRRLDVKRIRHEVFVTLVERWQNAPDLQVYVPWRRMATEAADAVQWAMDAAMSAPNASSTPTASGMPSEQEGK